MLVPWTALNGRHPTTSKCKKEAEQKWCRLAAEDLREITERPFQEYVRPLTSVPSFKYFEKILTASDNDLPAVASNLWKARKKWSWMTGILGWE